MACREPKDSPSHEGRAIEFVMIRREPCAAGMPAPARDPRPSIDLDREQLVGPGEVETPAPAEILGELELSHWFLEAGSPDQDQEPHLEWGWRSCSLRPYAWTGWFNDGLRGDHGFTMRSLSIPRADRSAVWGNPGRERRGAAPKPHHAGVVRAGGFAGLAWDAGGRGRDAPGDAPGDGRRENVAYLTSRSVARSGH